MNVTGVYKKLCSLLISAFEYKFRYELNSNVYHVVTVLDSSKLKNCHNRAYCTEIRARAFNQIDSVYSSFFKRVNPIPTEDSDEADLLNDEDDALNNYLINENVENNPKRSESTRIGRLNDIFKFNTNKYVVLVKFED
jgi:hypothetical protein